MKFTCDRSTLVETLAILARGVSSRSTLPVLSGILLEATEEGRLDMYATDMELSIKASLEAEVERTGELVVPARLFSDVVRNLAEELIDLEGSETTLRVRSGNAGFTLNAWTASDFPQTAVFSLEGALGVAKEPLIETLSKVGRAASRDETRPILTGVLMSIVGDKLRMVATDSYRLAVCDAPLERALAEDVHAIVPVRALTEVSRLVSSSGSPEIDIVVSENQILFHMNRRAGDVWVASRLIDGQFPSYKQLIPDSFDHEVEISKADFISAARRVSLLAQKSAPLRLTFTTGRLSMRAVTQDVGQAEETLDVDFTGESFEIGFSPAYLIDGIDAVDEDRVRMRFTNPLRPGLIRSKHDDFQYLIMPIRLSN
ncbi:MAG: DNA polymerase III subunit beta [Thermoleophilia bacterium]